MIALAVVAMVLALIPQVVVLVLLVVSSLPRRKVVEARVNTRRPRAELMRDLPIEILDGALDRMDHVEKRVERLERRRRSEGEGL